LIKNTLTGKQKRFLRSLGMTLEPIVPIGKEGITPAVVNSADEAIEKRELIKVRVLQNCLEDIGRNGLLWRRNFKKPKIELPK
jgi:RNA-binding protein